MIGDKDTNHSSLQNIKIENPNLDEISQKEHKK
jgi:hypothetical protein